MTDCRMKRVVSSSLYSEQSSDDEDTPPTESKGYIVSQIKKRAPSPLHSPTETVRMDLNLMQTANHLFEYINRSRTYDRVRKYIFMFMIFLLIASISSAIYFKDEGNVMDKCLMERFDEMKRPIDTVGVANVIVFRLSIAIVGLMLITFVLGNSGHQLLRLFHVLYLAAWYYCTFNLVTFLKLYLEDTSCNHHANSISGHFNFYVFAIFSLFFLNSKLMTKWNVKVKLTFNILFLVFAITSGMTLYETVFLGFHSLRQCLYGITLGTISHVIFATCLNNSAQTSKGDSNRYQDLFAFLFVYWLLSIIVNVWYESSTGHYVRWLKMIPSIILTILCGICGLVLSYMSN